MWNILIVNCITNSYIYNTCVTWQGIDYKLPEDDMIVSRSVIFCVRIVLLLVTVQNNLSVFVNQLISIVASS
jgi:hypothetical protein